jgi:hypothetical protein
VCEATVKKQECPESLRVNSGPHLFRHGLKKCSLFLKIKIKFRSKASASWTHDFKQRHVTKHDNLVDNAASEEIFIASELFQKQKLR